VWLRRQGLAWRACPSRLHCTILGPRPLRRPSRRRSSRRWSSHARRPPRQQIGRPPYPIPTARPGSKSVGHPTLSLCSAQAAKRWRPHHGLAWLAAPGSMYHAAHCDLTFHHMSVRSAGPAALLPGQPWTALMRSFVPPPASVTHPRCRWTSGHAQQAWLPVQHQPAPCTANCLCVHGRYTWIDENAEEAAAVRKRRRAQHMPELLGRGPPVRELHGLVHLQQYSWDLVWLPRHLRA